MKRNMYQAELNGHSVKITEKQLDRLYPNEILDLLIKKGLPIQNNFDSVGCLVRTNGVTILQCFKRGSKESLWSKKGKNTYIELIPLWKN